MKTVFLEVLQADDKAAALAQCAGGEDATAAGRRFEAEISAFAVVPGSPFAYWASDRLRQLFSNLAPLEAEGRIARRGVNSNDDERFLRMTWETFGRAWLLHAKGGEWSPYYADPHVLVNWGRNAEELEAERVTTRVYKAAIVPSKRHYFRPGLTWSRRTQGGLSFRAMPAGCIFGDKGPAIFVESDSGADLLALLGVVNSGSFRALVDLQMTFGSYEVGVIQRTPIPRLAQEGRQLLTDLVHRAWSLKRSVDTRVETSHAFTLPALLQGAGERLAVRAGLWADHVRAIEIEFTAIRAEIEQRCLDLYGIAEDDVVTTNGFESCVGRPRGADAEAAAEGETGDAGAVVVRTAAEALTEELVSWVVGVAFGRFDVRLATGVRDLPSEPQPFDPLPLCSPGMLTDEGGFPLAAAPSAYPIKFAESGILVDDPGDPEDLTSAVRLVFEVVFGASADAVWQEAAALLDPRSHDLREWLRSRFFEYHLKLYSKSRRKAPIVWQISTPSRRYSVWLYAHRLTADSFFRLHSDVVAPKLAHEERRLTSLVQGAGGRALASAREEIAEQEALVEELRVLVEEVRRVAPLWKPTMDDGIVLVMAPLWRLVPHKRWQKELKAKWGALVAGMYDWAQLAMHLWPERVVPKCAADRSLAIAHGLEEVFWKEEGSQWSARATPTRPVEEIVAERTSPAVKAALEALSDAPAVGVAGRRRTKAC
jgi:hypothetical protein